MLHAQLADLQKRLRKAREAREQIEKLEPEIRRQVQLGFDSGSYTTPIVELLDRKSGYLRIIDNAEKPLARYMLPGRELFPRRELF